MPGFCRSLVLLFVFTCSPCLASSNRLAALGGESRLFLDTSNLFIYPATVLEFPHFGAELFDDWGGVAYPLGSHALGLFFNRPTPQLTRLATYLHQNGSALFQDLDPQPWIDLLYGWGPRDGLCFGLSGRLAFDTLTRARAEASTSGADLRLGLRLGAAPGRTLDFTVGLTRQSFEDSPDGQNKIAETDGSGYLLSLRARHPLRSGLVLFPAVDFEAESYALAPAHRDFRAAQAALGLNAAPTREVLVIAGLLVDYQRTELRIPGVKTQEESVLTLPATIIAGEVKVGSVLFRLGMRHESRLARRERLRGEQLVETRSFDAVLQTELGLGLEFDDLEIDGLLERDFLRDGPHLFGGSRHGGGIFSKVSLTYHFTR